MHLISDISISTKKYLAHLRGSKKGKQILIAIFVFFLLLFLSIFLYFKNSEAVPAHGGSYTEGIVGSPRFLNPLFHIKSDTDRDLTEVIFASLLKYDKENNLVPDLAESLEIEGNRVFNITLKENAKWSDGEKITADDVVFTIQTIQSRPVQSPLRVGWEGVRVEKISETEVRFMLETPSPLFIEKLTLKPIPKHVWEDVNLADFQFSELNLNPVSSGAYMIESINSADFISSLSFIPNPYYFGNPPYIQKLNFIFFRSEQELLENKNLLNGFALSSIQTQINSSFNKYTYQLPRYFALFFDTESVNKDLRTALWHGTDKQKIIESLTNVVDISSPIIPEFYGLEIPSTLTEYNPEKSLEILKQQGYVLSDSGYFENIIQEEKSFQFTKRLEQDSQGEEVRELQRCFIELTISEYPELFPNGEITGYFDEETKEAVNRFQNIFKEEILNPHGFKNPTGIVANSTQNKLNSLCGGTIPQEKEILSIEITTTDHPLLDIVVDNLQDSWEKIGVLAKKRAVDLSTIEREILEDKNFQTFLFGISMESIPDPFRWWHSTQILSPGLNFTKFQTESTDHLLRDAISLPDEADRISALEEFQNALLEEKPAIFLYSPNYIYMVNRQIKGLRQGKIINSSQRLSNINNWYINTKRIWKKN